METYRKFVGRRIKAYREERSLSQEELAHAAGRSVHAISQLERGLHTPSLETFVALADIFGCSLDDLAGRNFSPSSPANERGEVEHSILQHINGMNLQELKAARMALDALISMKR